jgi:translin
MHLNKILEIIQEKLVKKDDVRKEIQNSMRTVLRLSKRAIFQIHKLKLEEATIDLRKARNILSKIESLPGDYTDLKYMGLVDSAFEEYAEAQIYLHLIKDDRFVSNEELNVPSVSYVLGLADVIGEIRRFVLDSLRKGETKKAEKNLELMEKIYFELTNLDEANLLIAGLRRKCDVSRRLVEATRGDVTLEVRRNHLEKKITELRKNLVSSIDK